MVLIIYTILISTHRLESGRNIVIFVRPIYLFVLRRTLGAPRRITKYLAPHWPPTKFIYICRYRYFNRVPCSCTSLIIGASFVRVNEAFCDFRWETWRPTSGIYCFIKLCGRPPWPRPCKLTFDLLTLKVVSKSRATWVTSVPILVFLGPLCSRLRPHVRERQTSDAHHRLMLPSTLGAWV